MLIRIAFWMILLCLPLFFLAKMLLIFTFLVISTFMMYASAFALLAGFMLLILTGLIFSLKKWWLILQRYFSAEQRGQRRILFIENQHKNRHRLFYFQRLQLTYFKEQQRKQILEINNQAQINALSEAIERDLKQMKARISKADFLQWQQENRRYLAQHNEQALVKLHHKISKLNRN
ncbi:MAG: hypothetical protein WCJ11_09510 [Methylococcaceae bacterium]